MKGRRNKRRKKGRHSPKQLESAYRVERREERTLASRMTTSKTLSSGSHSPISRWGGAVADVGRSHG